MVFQAGLASSRQYLVKVTLQIYWCEVTSGVPFGIVLC